MATQIIYDNDGYLISIKSGNVIPRNPTGVPFINLDIPEGKQVRVVDGVVVNTSVTPHEVMLEDIPKSDIEVLRNEVDAAILELTMAIYMGGGI